LAEECLGRRVSIKSLANTKEAPFRPKSPNHPKTPQNISSKIKKNRSYVESLWSTDTVATSATASLPMDPMNLRKTMALILSTKRKSVGHLSPRATVGLVTDAILSTEEKISSR